VRYRVLIAPRALSDAEAIYHWIADVQAAPLNAAKWLDGVFEVIATLDELPQRCPRAPECAYFEREIRQIVYHNHRVLFGIEGDTVEVFHIRHGAMLPLEPNDS
jgi:plasmid stabilization system protein ParE